MTVRERSRRQILLQPPSYPDTYGDTPGHDAEWPLRRIFAGFGYKVPAAE
jgi:hypothetical protein